MAMEMSKIRLTISNVLNVTSGDIFTLFSIFFFYMKQRVIFMYHIRKAILEKTKKQNVRNRRSVS